MVDIFWKSEEIGKPYCVRSAAENVGGSVVDILWKNARNWQAVLRPVCLRNEGGTVFFSFGSRDSMDFGREIRRQGGRPGGT